MSVGAERLGRVPRGALLAQEAWPCQRRQCGRAIGGSQCHASHLWRPCTWQATPLRARGARACCCCVPRPPPAPHHQPAHSAPSPTHTALPHRVTRSSSSRRTSCPTRRAGAQAPPAASPSPLPRRPWVAGRASRSHRAPPQPRAADRRRRSRRGTRCRSSSRPAAPRQTTRRTTRREGVWAPWRRVSGVRTACFRARYKYWSDLRPMPFFRLMFENSHSNCVDSRGGSIGDRAPRTVARRGGSARRIYRDTLDTHTAGCRAGAHLYVHISADVPTSSAVLGRSPPPARSASGQSPSPRA